jgi:Ras GTPase-activating-like protein IQGAP2/3
MTSAASSVYSQERAGHKRGISEAAGTAPRHNDRSSVERSPDHFYNHARQSLRPLPQAPAASPAAKRHSPHHVRQSADRYTQHQSEDPFVSIKDHHPRLHDGIDQSHTYHTHTNPHSSAFVTSNLQELQKSSTGHLRALSKFAQNSESEDYSITAPAPSVVGLHNRRQLKRTDSTAGEKSQNGRGSGRNYGWAERNWMDKQRQFLQAYEYLCHIGEAKEWIEDVIHKPIPPIVQLEQALRDGVTLAEIVQALCPQQRLRIFRHEKLQFRHSDNIALFFRFLEDVELPDLFRFELIDLYEKKNIPKVIYCIHALSWLLYRKGIVDFRIGNLVGQLEFDHHDLEQTQKGLDKAGVNMPSFAGMGASFGAELEPQPEPEPEPIETEDERIDRELKEHEIVIMDFQTQIKGALLRIKLGDEMTRLWDAEHMLIDLQARIRGDWARQIIDYRLQMRRFAVNLQAATRGYLTRTRQQQSEKWWKSKEMDVLKLQSLVRACKARAKVQNLKTLARKEESGIRLIQAAVRGAFARREACDQYEATREAEGVVEDLQAAIRGMLVRFNFQKQRTLLERQGLSIIRFQAASRASLLRVNQHRKYEALHSLSHRWTDLQATVRGRATRTHFLQFRARLQTHSTAISRLQAHIRGAIAREESNALRLALFKQQPTILQIQADVRGLLLRQRIAEELCALRAESKAITRLQSLARGATERRRIDDILQQLDLNETEIVLLHGMIRAMLVRGQVGDTLAELDSHEGSIVEFQSAIRASIVRKRFAEKKRFFKENMEKVVKIQSIVRAKIQGEAYKSLTNGKNPPVGTLKGFVHLLNDSDFDFDEEIEFERLRKTVVQHVRQNELADQYITQLDIKIALLVKNKITLDEVVKHQRHFGGHVGTLLPNSDISSKDPFDLKALNKTSRRKLEHYQELFFLLQTQPQYLARLFRRIREHATAEKECDRIKHLMMGLFGYAQKRREEYYLVKLIVRSLKEEVDSAHSLQDYLRSNAFWNRLFGAYIKSPRDRKFLQDVLGGIIKENFIDNRQLDLESDPMQIYLSAINNEELRTGQRSRRSPNVPREEAIRDPETRATFIHHMQDLRDIADQFFASLEDLLHRMPFGVRFIAQQTYDYLVARFQDEEPARILQIVGQWMWRNYLHPALTEPEKYGVVDRGLTQEQKRNIGEVTKVLAQAVSGKEFGGENIYLQPLNTYIRESMYRFSEIWRHGKSFITYANREKS